MATDLQFPAGAKLFPLRPDLADELCAFDSARAPLPKADVDEFYTKLGVTRIGTLMVQLLNERRRHFVPGRYIAYYSMVPKQTKRVVPVAYDGKQAVSLSWDESGLLTNLSKKAADSLAIAPWCFTDVFMDPPATAPADIVVSRSAVLHDTMKGVAAVVERLVAIKFAQAFHDW